MESKASLDLLAKIITLGVILLLIFLGRNSVRILVDLSNLNLTDILIHSSILFFFVVIILGSYLFSPKKYILNDDQLIIKRPFNSVILELDDISDIELVAKINIAGTIRTFGVGGLFGYYGKYYNKNLGHMTWYLSQRKNLVLLITKEGKKILISPDDYNMGDYLRIYLKERNSNEEKK